MTILPTQPAELTASECSSMWCVLLFLARLAAALIGK